MGRLSKRTYSYSKHTIAYVEHLCAEFSHNYRLYENLKADLLEDKIWSFTSKQINTKINLYRPSDTTAEAALKLLERERDREFQQVALFISAVKRVYKELSDWNKNWFFLNLLDNKNSSIKRDLEDKRLRYSILSNVCYYMGIPEDGPIIRNKIEVEPIAEEAFLRI